MGQHPRRYARGAAGRNAADQQRPAGRPRRPPAGKALFAKHCATCHRLFGEGNQVGPDLTHANRKNVDELLATIVNPSAVIRKEFLSFLLHTADGRVLTGLLVDQTPSTVTLLTAKNERIAIARDQIETLVESPTSLMPENLLGPLKPQELRDLFAYLQSEPATAVAVRHEGRRSEQPRGNMGKWRR